MHFIRNLFGFRISQPTVSGLWYAFLWMMIGALILSLLLQGEMLDEPELALYTYLVHGMPFCSAASSPAKGRSREAGTRVV
ncbi:hypothetical protein HMSSN036_73230 [Paenibacillus macerans]|nr:hypothetical protein HMSSN036_73230 [Paenibacillus macerans]